MNAVSTSNLRRRKLSSSFLLRLASNSNKINLTKLSLANFAAVRTARTGTVRAKARYANDKMALFPSQFVNVRLELGNITGAVLVPVTAVSTPYLAFHSS